ncbi:IKI3-domain-containing protein [Jaminaea rosea]|uniref:IKI3-domain-containing protein n=1 Tax=Jaminaea rosea TaxID=1569628 RepID=A0A316V1N9_9BASI|nr:IKI3-domain-containing protein [Jaminaea rosea]PWN29335.1 IKI3-domain-containing protein [Jaminaea rosea]
MRDLRCIQRAEHALTHSHATALTSHSKVAYLVSHTRPSPDGQCTFDIESIDIETGASKHILNIDLVASSDTSSSPQSQVRSLVYLSDGGSAAGDEAALCLITAGGDILLIPLGTSDDDTEDPDGSPAPPAQIMGSVEQGILAASWSPDEESVILIVADEDAPSSSSAAGAREKLLVMSRDFEVLEERLIREQGRGEEPVNVGWGSKATQFHGSAGKGAAAAAAAAANASSDSSATQQLRPLDDDDGLPHISWREDCAYFVVSSLEPVSGRGSRRLIRTFERSGQLSALSDEGEKGLSHIVAIKPVGNIIATSQRFSAGAEGEDDSFARGREGRHDIVFFERNGLRRGGFSLREESGAALDGKEGGITEPPLMDKEAKGRLDQQASWSRPHKIVELQWNADGSCLAVWLRREDGSDAVQLWTMANWHWYLKQELTQEDALLRSMQWGRQEDTQLILLWRHHEAGTGSLLQSWQFHSTTYAQRIADKTATSSAVAVTDGGAQRLTFFDQQTVPPPMCSLVLPTTKSAVWRSVLDLEQWMEDGDAMGGFTPRDKAWAERSVGKKLVNVLALLHPDGKRVFTYAIVWASRKAKPVVSCMVVVEGQLQGHQVAINIDAACTRLDVCVLGSGTTWHRSAALRLQAESHQLKMEGESSLASVSLPQRSAVLAVDPSRSGKDAFVLHTSTGAIEPALAAQEDRLPLADLGTFCPSLQVQATSDLQPLFIGLSPSNTLLCSVENAVTPSKLAHDATSFTLSPPFLIWTNTSHEARFLPLDSLTTSPSESLDRRVERGSRIVVSCPRQMALVLQMPRGNLERVFPRCMVLDRVRSELDRGRYRQALLHCRSHRIDLNFLYDHNPAKFISDVEHFVDQVDETDLLNLFLSGLKHVAPEATNAICSAFISELTKRGKKHLHSILTAHVKKLPADYEAALALVRDQDQHAASEALEYVIFLAPLDSLFDVALGMYDLTLALMVAQHSKKKDPREYLPFLRELREVKPLERQRYRIDDHLRRYGKALRWLAQCNDAEDEAMEYTFTHRLFAEAFEIWQGEPKKWRRAQGLYGEYLLGRQKWSDAGLAFQLAGDVNRALDAFQSAGAWHDCFALAAVHAPQSIPQLATSMAERLEDTARYSEAARVKLEYGRDVEGALDSFARAHDITECRRVCARYGRMDLVETHVKPAALHSQSVIMDDIAEMSEQMSKQVARLAELRQRSEEQPGVFYGDGDDGPAGAAADIDVQSDTSTQLTRFTRYTKAPTHAGTLSSLSATSQGDGSSKKGKKQKKKDAMAKASGKKGSVYEEDYLYESLRKLLNERLGAVQDDAARLIPNLVVLGPSHRLAAHALQQALDRFEEQAHAASKELYDVAVQVGVKADEARIAALTNASGVAATGATLDLLAGTTRLDQAAQRTRIEVAQRKWRSEMLGTMMGGTAAAVSSNNGVAGR